MILSPFLSLFALGLVPHVLAKSSSHTSTKEQPQPALGAKCDASGTKDEFGCCAFPEGEWSIQVKPIPAGSCFEKNDPITVEWTVVPHRGAGGTWASKKPFDKYATVSGAIALDSDPTLKVGPEDKDAHILYVYTPAGGYAACVSEGKQTFKIDAGNFEILNKTDPLIYPYAKWATYSAAVLAVTPKYSDPTIVYDLLPDPRDGPQGQFVLAEDCAKWRQEVGPSKIGQDPGVGSTGGGSSSSGNGGSGGSSGGSDGSGGSSGSGNGQHHSGNGHHGHQGHHRGGN